MWPGTGPAKILDPFAGTGKITRLHAWLPKAEFYGYEIEPEWAEQARAAGCACTTGDSRQMHYPDAMFDAICTSPTYGNRMADHHEAPRRQPAPHLSPRARPAADTRELRGAAMGRGSRESTARCTWRSGPNAAAC